MTYQPQLSGFDGDIDRPDASLSPRGLSYTAGFLSADEEQELMHEVDVVNAANWLPDLSRRVQHYGYRYDYKARTISRDMWLGPLPQWLQTVGQRLVNEGYFDQCPDQVIVNEYLPGQGIARHTDCVPCFGPTLVTVSLNSDCVMDFEHSDTGSMFELLLERRSLAALTGDARFVWKHGIAKRRSDAHPRGRVGRQRRISLTFRSVITDFRLPAPSPR